MCFHFDSTCTDFLKAVFARGYLDAQLTVHNWFSITFQTEKFRTRGNSLNALRREILAPAKTDLESPRIAIVNSQTVDKIQVERMRRGVLLLPRRENHQLGLLTTAITATHTSIERTIERTKRKSCGDFSQLPFLTLEYPIPSTLQYLIIFPNIIY